jgi:hypothetical protein
MADQSKKTGVYDSPDPTPSPTSGLGSFVGTEAKPITATGAHPASASHDHASSRVASAKTTGMLGTVPTWAWALAVVVVLALLAMMLFD